MIVLDKLWVYVYLPIWSFIANCIYWMFHFPSLIPAIREKKKIADSITNLCAVKGYVKYFRYTDDGYKDWRPWVITFINNRYRDNCDGAAIWGKFLFKCLGVNSKIYTLRGPLDDLTVCITNTRFSMIYNNEFERLPPPKRSLFEKRLLDKFDGLYDRIV